MLQLNHWFPSSYISWRFNHHLSARDPRPPKLVTERSKRVNTRAVSVLHRRERNPASSTRDMFSMSSTFTLSENLTCSIRPPPPFPQAPTQIFSLCPPRPRQTPRLPPQLLSRTKDSGDGFNYSREDFIYF